MTTTTTRPRRELPIDVQFRNPITGALRVAPFPGSATCDRIEVFNIAAAVHYGRVVLIVSLAPEPRRGFEITFDADSADILARCLRVAAHYLHPALAERDR